MLKLYKDELEALFVSGLGVGLGELAINKRDVIYLWEFIQKTEVTDCFLTIGKKRYLLSRIKLEELKKVLK